jgi:hypothetical protein
MHGSKAFSIIANEARAKNAKEYSAKSYLKRFVKTEKQAYFKVIDYFSACQ